MPKCKHYYLQVEEFNDMGQVVSCTHCDLTFQLSEAAGSQDYLPFVHTMPARWGEDREVVFLIHHSIVKLRDEGK